MAMEKKESKAVQPLSQDESARQDEGACETVARARARKRRRWPVAVGVTAAIVLVAAVGGVVWHEQPSFCNAICHTPMDPYLPTYEAQPGQEAVDKFGNTVANATGMMAAAHRIAGESCLSCHVPTMSEQVTEGLEWVSGNYVAPPEERSLDDLAEARGMDGQEFCLNEQCHNLTYGELAEKTADRAYNPHETHFDGLECGDCHKAHRESVLYCTRCHADAEAEMPAGWVTFAAGEAAVAGGAVA